MAQAAAYRQEKGLDFLIEVDGGINPETAGVAAGHGAEVLVAGSAVYGKSDYAAAIPVHPGSSRCREVTIIAAYTDAPERFPR